MSDFTSLRRANQMRNAEWDTEHHVSGAFRASELAGESGELIEELLTIIAFARHSSRVGNIVKKLERHHLGLRGSKVCPEALAKELADVTICVDLLAMHYGIDLWSAIVAKFNETSKAQGFRTVLTQDGGVLAPAIRSKQYEPPTETNP